MQKEGGAPTVTLIWEFTVDTHNKGKGANPILRKSDGRGKWEEHKKSARKKEVLGKKTECGRMALTCLNREAVSNQNKKCGPGMPAGKRDRKTTKSETDGG